MFYTSNIGKKLLKSKAVKWWFEVEKSHFRFVRLSRSQLFLTNEWDCWHKMLKTLFDKCRKKDCSTFKQAWEKCIFCHFYLPFITSKREKMNIGYENFVSPTEMFTEIKLQKWLRKLDFVQQPKSVWSHTKVDYHEW